MTMKKFIQILNIIMGSVVGLFIGYSVFISWNHKTNPELYAYYSAPWYTGIWIYGAFALAVLVVCIVIKAILKHCIKKSESALSKF